MEKAKGKAGLGILHVEDRILDSEMVFKALCGEGVRCAIRRVETRADFEQALREGTFDVILSDYSLPGFDGMSALEMAKALRPEIPFIFLSGTIGEDRAVELLKNGAVDYVLKDRLGRLASSIVRAHEEAEERRKRRKAEALLKERNELLTRIIESVDDLIAVVDWHGRLVYGSPSCWRLVRGGAEQAHFCESISSEDYERAMGAFQEILVSGASRRMNYRAADDTGRMRHFESQWSAMRDNAGGIRHVVIVSRDVTERENASKTIREQAALLDQARDAIFVRDLEQRVTYWSKGAERLYGWKAEEILGKRASDLLYKPGSARRESFWNEVLRKGEWIGELTQVTKSGEEIHVESRRTLLRGPGGDPQAVLNINTDITETKRLRAQVLRSQRLESIGSLASGIAHDLNNVLTPVLVATELIKEQILDEEGRRMLEMANSSAKRGADLVKQVLQFARGGKAERGPILLSSLVREVVQFVQGTFPKSIKIVVRLEEQITVIGDATQIHQVLLNLMVNSRDAMPEGGTITISSALKHFENKLVAGKAETVSGWFAELAVEDTGVGIPEEVLPRIFEPFFSTKSPGTGTGLGLPTVLSITTNHSGFLEVSSKASFGTTFRVYLPALEKAPPAQELPRAPLPEGNGKCVLVVDDELALLEMTKGLLEAFGYNVLTARGAEEALSQARQAGSTIHAMITDLEMPGMDGEQLGREVRRISPGTIIVCVSGVADEAVMERCKTWASACLRKPCSTTDLLTTLSRLIAG